MPPWWDYAEEGMRVMKEMAGNTGQSSMIELIEEEYRAYCEHVGNGRSSNDRKEGLKEWNEFWETCTARLDDKQKGGFISILSYGYLYIGGDEIPDDPAEKTLESEGMKMWDGGSKIRDTDMAAGRAWKPPRQRNDGGL